MFRPEPIPAAATSSPAEETDTSCLGFFSRRIGLISICCTLVLMSAFHFFTTIEYIVVTRGGDRAIFIIYFLVNLMDGAASGLVLVGIRDGVVRDRLKIWLIWNLIYTGVLLLLVIIQLSVLTILAGLIVLTGMQAGLMLSFRIYSVWTGWKYRQELTSAPSPSAHRVPVF